MTTEYELKLEEWLTVPKETEHLEFKEAKTQFDTTKLFRYCAALSNEGGGHLILGVTDKPPREIIGTKAFPAINKIKASILKKLGFRVEMYEIDHTNGRVLIFSIPARPTGQPYALDGAYWMRVGESLEVMTPDVLKRIFAEDKQDWFSQAACSSKTPDDVINLLDTQTYFDLLKEPYPTTQDMVLDRLEKEELIRKTSDGLVITNLAAIMLAKNLGDFSSALNRKAPRVIIYEGINKLKTRDDLPGSKGYAVGFNGLVEFVHAAAPQNEFIEEGVREDLKMFPKQALRELIANALVHQDFDETGTSVMIEMYADRVEISNPGKPPIDIDRFIDSVRSRNERLTYLMRRLGICEEKGSGIDKVIYAAELYQLPAPDFQDGQTHTKAILYSHLEFADMSDTDRIRACYQHCCLQYVSNQKMSNQSLRERFRLGKEKTSAVSQIIGATKEAGYIKQDELGAKSLRYVRYLPSWA